MGTSKTNRRDEIIRIASHLFKEKGYHATTLQDIADELHVSKPALYYHIKSKEEVLSEIFNRGIIVAIEGLEAVLESDARPMEKFRRILLNHVRAVIDNIETMAVSHHETAALPRKTYRKFVDQVRRYQDLIKDVYREGVEAGEFRPMDPTLAVNAVLGMVNWLYRWYEPKGGQSPDEVAAALVEIAERGIRK